MAVVPREAQALTPQGSPLGHSYRMHSVPLDLNSMSVAPDKLISDSAPVFVQG